MDKLLDVLFSIVGSIVTCVVPAVVWALVMTGCYQLVREQVRRLRIVPQRSPKLVQKSTS